jgi:hypothetical protein
MMIELLKQNGFWCCYEKSEEIFDLFGTYILPTPFAATMPSNEVQARIAALNPNKQVKIKRGEQVS